MHRTMHMLNEKLVHGMARLVTLLQIRKNSPIKGKESRLVSIERKE